MINMPFLSCWSHESPDWLPCIALRLRQGLCGTFPDRAELNTATTGHTDAHTGSDVKLLNIWGLWGICSSRGLSLCCGRELEWRCEWATAQNWPESFQVSLCVLSVSVMHSFEFIFHYTRTILIGSRYVDGILRFCVSWIYSMFTSFHLTFCMS